MVVYPHQWSDKDKTTYHDNGQKAFQTCKDTCPYCGERIIWKRTTDTWEQLIPGIWEPVWDEAIAWSSSCESCQLEYIDPYHDGTIHVYKQGISNVTQS